MDILKIHYVKKKKSVTSYSAENTVNLRSYTVSFSTLANSLDTSISHFLGCGCEVFGTETRFVPSVYTVRVYSQIRLLQQHGCSCVMILYFFIYIPLVVDETDHLQISFLNHIHKSKQIEN